ncbi:MAG: LysM peptidoglycan-binding domain-containing protein [Bacillota bacterium]|nr:LysM peptidoglycan-binding domain-containing protein [Bacillota bacterium]
MRNKYIFRLCALLLVLSFLSVTSYAQSQYTIEKGDTLGGIAKKFGIKVQDIKNANGIQNDSITAGKILIIPDPGSTPTQAPSGQPTGEQGITASANINVEPESESLEDISIDFRNTDIRDILNVISNFSNKRILYIGQPQKISITASVVSYIKALNLITEKANNLSYLVDNDVVIVGPKDRLQNTFIYEELATKLKLSNLNAQQLIEVTDSLGIETRSVKVNKKDAHILLIEATPRNIAYAMLVSRMIDKKEYFSKDDKGNSVLNKVELSFKNINANDFEAVLQKLNIKASIVTKPDDLSYAMAVGSKDTITDVSNIFQNLETTKNDSAESMLEVSKYKPENINAKAAYDAVSANTFGAHVILQSGTSPSELYIVGTQDQCQNCIDALKEADIASTPKS